MARLAIITARGGSKRIPGKNVKEFCGKPIIAYSISAALESGIFDEVMVSTDSMEIVDVAKEYGAVVPFMRSREASDDFATTADVLVEVVTEYKKRGFEYETIACIYPTAPFVTGSKLTDAMCRFEMERAGCIMAVVQYDFPPQRAFLVKNGKVTFQYPEYGRSRSQDLPPIYHDCGQFYIIRTDVLMEYRSLLVPDTVPYIVPGTEVQDIDTLTDWEIAEAKFSVLFKHQEEADVQAF